MKIRAAELYAVVLLNRSTAQNLCSGTIVSARARIFLLQHENSHVSVELNISIPSVHPSFHAPHCRRARFAGSVCPIVSALDSQDLDVPWFTGIIYKFRVLVQVGYSANPG